MRKFWLTLKDARLRAVLKALEASGPGLGELTEDPASAASFFRPLRAALTAAAASPPSSPASSRALTAAEDLMARLDKLFSDLALHKTAPDAAAREALLYLQQACGQAPRLLSLSGRAGAAAEIRGLSAGARKSLALARAAADSAPANFPQNLKFSSIYSGLDAVVDAYERCAEALFEVNT
jgi:hypothetical protein